MVRFKLSLFKIPTHQWHILTLRAQVLYLLPRLYLHQEPEEYTLDTTKVISD